MTKKNRNISIFDIGQIDLLYSIKMNMIIGSIYLFFNIHNFDFSEAKRIQQGKTSTSFAHRFELNQVDV